MNKTAIRNFAVTARTLLNDQVRNKAALYGITEKEIKKIDLFKDGFRVGDRVYDQTVLVQYRQLVKEIEHKGYNQVMEEVAYTWFNRFIALRFMEVNGYLPFNIHTRVLSSVDGKVEPEIIGAAKDLGLVSEDTYYSCFDKGDIEGLYKIILINLCNKLSTIMPQMFEPLADYTELLLPDQLYTPGGIINLLVTEIEEEDFRNQVEIIGWLYQFYIAEKKEQVDKAVKKGRKVSKDDLPAKTQLFTPKWIVKYLVENSLGRLWLERGDENSHLKENWQYYLDTELIVEEDKISPEEIKILDPACGSGHMLVYAFDVLYDIYASCGYAESHIPQLILTKNLFGLDVDERAAQLTYFALIMKARSKNRRLFRHEEPITVNVCAIKESNTISSAEIPTQGQLTFDENHRRTAEYLIKTFTNAREYGSIIKVDPMDYDGLAAHLEGLTYSKQADLFDSAFRERIAKDMPDLIRQAKIMSQKYDIVVTNPPYLGKGMSPLLAKYVRDNYPDSKADLFAVFMEIPLVKKGGYLAMINQHSWMFLSSYKKLRRKVVQRKTITSMLHLGSRAFEEISGEVVQSTAFVLKNESIPDFIGEYVRLVDFDKASDKRGKVLKATKDKKCRYRFRSGSKDFIQIPGSPIAYWVSESLTNLFSGNQIIRDIAEPKTGMTTGDNNKFLRLWFEINHDKLQLHSATPEEAKSSPLKWFPYSKGGGYRKWFGWNEYVVDWENNGYRIKNAERNGRRIASVRNERFYFRQGITWSAVTSAKFSARFVQKGFLFDSGGSSVFPTGNYLYYLLGLLSTKIAEHVIRIFNPTLNFQPNDIARIPIIVNDVENIVRIVKQNIALSRADWDDFETSWDFKVHPLVRHKAARIEDAFATWEKVAAERFNRLKANEEELNRIFIDIYGLQDELTPEVAEEDVTVRKADLERDIKSLLSYAVGCMFGRYSLDQEGLIYAGGDFDLTAYKTFLPVEDNVILVTDQDFFDHDIVFRFVEFVDKVYGSEHREENLEFIAQALKPGSTKTPLQVIRDYFFNDFFKDHCQIYKKRPIYWQFDTGRAGAMKALVYLHRMDESTPARVRTDYLHPLMRAYEGEIRRLEQMSAETLTAAERAVYRRQKENLQKKVAEIMKYDPVLAHIAHRRLILDLDDGVAVNYSKFQNVTVKQDGKNAVRANLLTKI